MKKIKITSQYEARLDSYLSDELNGKLSRNHIKSLIKNGKVSVDGENINKPSKIIKSNSEILVHDYITEENIIRSYPLPNTENINIEVLYEDSFIAVIDKPAFISMHPGNGKRKFNISDYIQIKWPNIKNVGEKNRRGIVHRLDKDTSGLLIIALKEISYKKLIEMQKNRKIKKSYYVLVDGHPQLEKGIIDAPIGRNPKNRTKQDIIYGGKEAITEYKTIKKYDNFSFLGIKIKTGRTHQIRVHMKALGHPVVGDKKYNNFTHNIKRQFLHAYNIKFKHPINDKIIDINSKIPTELNDFLKNLS
ncbi:MAG: pseudouridine synthase [Chloroflexi bacterium]|nr:pseudouridine synthase [Chloroflexota bacterium]